MWDLTGKYLERIPLHLEIINIVPPTIFQGDPEALRRMCEALLHYTVTKVQRALEIDMDLEILTKLKAINTIIELD